MGQLSVGERFELICGAFDHEPPDEVEFEVRAQQTRGPVVLSPIVFTADEQLEVPAIIISAPNGGDRPLAIALHQTTQPASLGKGEPAGLGGARNLHYGLELAERGYDVICPDYPLFGDYGLDLDAMYASERYRSVTAKGIRNHIVAVSVLKSFVGSARDDVVAVGHSLGGSNALFLGMFDARVTAVICSAGMSDFRSYAQHSPTRDLSGWARRDKYMPLIATRYESDYRRMPVDFGEMIGSLAPKKVFLNIPRNDQVFKFDGAMRALKVGRRCYEDAGCGARLAFATPRSAHDFPDVTRKQAYAFVSPD